MRKWLGAREVGLKISKKDRKAVERQRRPERLSDLNQGGV
jgi:RNase P protein component